MKKIKLTLYCLLATIVCLLASFQSKPQDDLSGWYADGVKVDKIDCYGFKTLQLVVKYNEEWKDLTKIKVEVAFSGDYGKVGIKLIPVSNISSYVKGGYFVYSVFLPGANGKDPSTPGGANLISQDDKDQNKEKHFPDGPVYALISQLGLKFSSGKSKEHGNPAQDETLVFNLKGLTQTSIEEIYDSQSQKYIKEPRYNNKMLTSKYTLTLTGRTLFHYEKGTKYPNLYEQPCTYPGTKVDFNNLGK